MSISIQKKLLYVPILNFITIMFSWLRMYYKNNIPKSRFIKNVLKILLICLLITIPQIIVDKYIDVYMIKNILFFARVILYLFIPSYFALKDQEKFNIEQTKKI